MAPWVEPNFDRLKSATSDQDLAKFVKDLQTFVKKAQDLNRNNGISAELEHFMADKAGLLTPTFRLIFERIQIAISNPVAAAVSDLLDLCLEHFIERRPDIDDGLEGVEAAVEVLISCCLRAMLNQLMPGSHKEVGDPYPAHNALARKRVTAEIYRRTLPQFCRYMNIIPHICNPPTKLCFCMQLRPLDLWIELIVLHEIPSIAPEIFAPFIRKLHENIFKKVWSRGWFVCLHSIYPDHGQKEINEWFREIFLRLRELFDTKQAVQKRVITTENINDSPVDISLAASDDSVPVLSLLNKMALTSPTLYNSNCADNLEWMVFNPQQPCLHVLILLSSLTSVDQHLLKGRGNRWYPALDKLKMSDNLRHSAALKVGEIFVNLLINATTQLHDADEAKRVVSLMANALTRSPHRMSVKRSVLEVWLLMSKIPQVATQLKPRKRDVDTLVQDKQLGALSSILSKKLANAAEAEASKPVLNQSSSKTAHQVPNQLDSAACVIM